MNGRVGLSLFVCVAAGSLPGRALGAPGPTEQAAAQVLFDEGKALAQAGNYAVACPKFEESQRLDPRIATEFKLADCFEHAGRTASAWVHFLSVATATAALHDAAREEVARARAKALEPRLSRLSIQVNAGDTAGLVLRRDGAEVGRAQWATPVPIDPGAHVVEAAAPGRIAWKTTITVADGDATASVAIPELVLAVEPVVVPPVPTVPPAAPTIEPSRPTFGAQRVAGVVVGVAGLALAGVGTAFGLLAKSNRDASVPYCPKPGALCTQPGLDLYDQAKTDATVSTATFIAGGAAVALGVVLLAIAPSSRVKPGTTLGMAPLVTPGFAGAALRGSM
jgi:hypothetical protein